MAHSSKRPSGTSPRADNALSDLRLYVPRESAVFAKTKEQFGGLSNMAAGYPLRVNDVSVRTSEALYQACRYPHLPDVQRAIIEEASPMTAKMVSKRYIHQSRSDWDDVRVPVMRWCLRLKLVQHFDRFSELLLSTSGRPIVEYSRKDAYWAAKPTPGGHLQGENILGRLLMELRDKLERGEADALRDIPRLALRDFVLFGEPIIAGQRRGNNTSHQSALLL
ncbi:NADAR family protein [Burkholderia pseudomallei]|uniref:NADAR family protein n=1 Tax=Burkholderia pseudomallei TaxID=28450 RepID=UPI00050F5826|nr:NADAR family protein [Burkholderia pseudomallei]KGC31573.1 hypothetical protein DO73_2040 [Burkholderia pseudomallei]KGD15903.1 hypothetical protein DP42_3895 [Burkholderia pseudomallei]